MDVTDAEKAILNLTLDDIKNGYLSSILDELWNDGVKEGKEEAESEFELKCDNCEKIDPEDYDPGEPDQDESRN